VLPNHIKNVDDAVDYLYEWIDSIGQPTEDPVIEVDPGGMHFRTTLSVTGTSTLQTRFTLDVDWAPTFYRFNLRDTSIGNRLVWRFEMQAGHPEAGLWHVHVGPDESDRRPTSPVSLEGILAEIQRTVTGNWSIEDSPYLLDSPWSGEGDASYVSATGAHPTRPPTYSPMSALSADALSGLLPPLNARWANAARRRLPSRNRPQPAPRTSAPLPYWWRGGGRRASAGQPMTSYVPYCPQVDRWLCRLPGTRQARPAAGC